MTQPIPETAEHRAALTRAITEQTGLDEAAIERVVRAFYAAARRDPLLGPVFDRVTEWEHHTARVSAFWSSVARMTGSYHGNPMAAHLPLGLGPAHFARWLALFEATAQAECTPEGAAHLIERARRIARSLEMGIAVQRGELPPVRRRGQGG
ncbi:group III truncated hemoglobin [Siccirubricoccus sp. KC 17139]|uniref:Group III truncated hemoglobin n=1 Tax=Siccirubricoccus soli TaxID=2899147 RepID=A0ABT1DEW2_9PROT|nr:group III truncated hemoglobin [Siccirubricoccus soli]MCO6419505.1 group III truncated hemoglobin [Siccirubricoccus soli]MCP2685640.1 group III truncated hemoglobin [Siccirubricoccus soli]